MRNGKHSTWSLVVQASSLLLSHIMLKCPNDDLSTFYQGRIPFLSFDLLNYLMGDHVPSADALITGALSPSPQS